jgi:hydrogenase-4 component B
MALMALGGLGACGGIVMALSQRDIKRVLAYSTIENAGLIALSIGAALLSAAAGQPLVAALAWSAALLHVWNHAVSKSLLFFTAGAVAQVVGSRDLERWGGLLRRLPWLSTTLLVGAAALVGLPGTHGFASVWLLLLSLFRGAQSLVGVDRLAMLLAVFAVAFTEGATLACFVRIVGVGLLGAPRSLGATNAVPPRDAGLVFTAALLACACFALVGLVHPMLMLLGRAVAQLAPGAPFDRVQRIASPLPWLAALPLVMAALVLLYRAWLRRSRTIAWTVTWDCGYARPEASMQYTASSLSQPVTRMLEPALRTTVEEHLPTGLWPATMNWESRTPERALAEVYRPAFRRIADWLGFFRRLQEGRVMVYLRFIGVALLVLLVWLFWPVEMPR